MRSRLIPLIVCAVLLGGLAAAALGQVDSPSPARAAAVHATGSFQISNSDEGQPIFADDGLAPGGSARGKVTIEDSGSVAVALKLAHGELTDTPGVGGGILSRQLWLAVTDITSPGAPRTLYSGPLATMPEQDAGRLKPGDSRTYEFVATLPDGAPSAQNGLQSASITVAYSWSAEEVSDGGGGVENRGVPPAGAGGPGGGTVPGPQPGPALDLTVPKILPKLTGGSLVTYVNCTASCRISVRGKLRATAHGHHHTAKVHFDPKRTYTRGLKKMRIPIPRGLRNWLRRMPPPQKLQAKLRFEAIGTAGGQDAVKKTVQLRVPH